MRVFFLIEEVIMVVTEPIGEGAIIGDRVDLNIEGGLARNLDFLHEANIPRICVFILPALVVYIG